MKTRFTRSLPTSTFCRSSTATTCPAISPAVRFRCSPSFAVRQNWQFTAQPTWLETQVVPLAAVAHLALVPFGHPDSLHGQPIERLPLDQIAFRTVNRGENLDDLRPPHQPASLREFPAQGLWQSCNPVNFNNPLAIDGLGQLPAPPFGLPDRPHALGQFENIHAKKTSQAST